MGPFQGRVGNATGLGLVFQETAQRLPFAMMRKPVRFQKAGGCLFDAMFVRFGWEMGPGEVRDRGAEARMASLLVEAVLARL